MDKRFYGENRRRVAEYMTGNDAMLFLSGRSVRKSADENFPFFSATIPPTIEEIES